MCQSPICRDTHFYGEVLFSYTTASGKVSIPYMSGHPFLLNTVNKRSKIVSSVSIPYMSGHPFLPDNGGIGLEFYYGVSIPYMSGHPFLRKHNLVFGGCDSGCVNPLYVGTPIST